EELRPRKEAAQEERRVARADPQGDTGRSARPQVHQQRAERNAGPRSLAELGSLAAVLPCPHRRGDDQGGSRPLPAVYRVPERPYGTTHEMLGGGRQAFGEVSHRQRLNSANRSWDDAALVGGNEGQGPGLMPTIRRNPVLHVALTSSPGASDPPFHSRRA